MPDDPDPGWPFWQLLNIVLILALVKTAKPAWCPVIDGQIQNAIYSKAKVQP
jgi:hypothetical protein